LTNTPGVRTVPVKVVSEPALQLVGRLPHNEPLQLGVPDTHVCAPLDGFARHAEPLLQLPVQLVLLLLQLVQQLMT
jgi:hypothetical protein